MSIAYSIMCDDASGCGITAAAVPSTVGLSAYRRMLRERGWSWSSRTGRDLCPECTRRRVASVDSRFRVHIATADTL